MIKYWAFRLFATLDRKKKKNDSSGNDLSQPQRSSDGKKTIFRKVAIVVAILFVFSLIVGLTSYYTTRPKNTVLSNHDYAQLVINSGSDKITIGGAKSTISSSNDPNNLSNLSKVENATLEIFTSYTNYQNSQNPTYTISLVSDGLLTNSLLRSYLQVSSYALEMTAAGSVLPVIFNVSYSTNGTAATIGLFNLVLYYNLGAPTATPNPLIAFFASAIPNLAVEQSSQYNWAYLIFNLIPLIIFILIFVAYFRMMKKQGGMGGDSIFSIGKINTKNTKTNVRFTDVAGIAEVKEELMEIVDFVKRPQKYAAMGARIPKGLILYGPPGTGKTLIAKAVAGEANCNFFPVSGSSFEDMLVGVGAKRVRDLFQKARKEAPAIIFIDEIDSVAGKRGNSDMMGGNSNIADQTINQLLTEMDGFTTTTNVVVIAATNRLDILDPAILRPGRFDRQIQVALPDIKERKEILQIHAKNKNLSSKVSLDDVARRTPGFSGAQLENVLNEAALLAVRENQTVISMANLDEAIDRTIGGPQRKNKVITEAEKRQIAYHEGGHALVGLHTPGTEVVQKITIIPRGNAAGYTLQTPQEQERQIQTKEELLNQMRMTLGGRAAEEIIFGSNNITTGAANDLYKVSMIARSMVTQMGMSNLGLTQYVPSEGQQPVQKLFSEQTNKMIDDTINEMIQQEYEKAKEIIHNNRLELDLIVETLLVLETILKNQIDYIHENLKLPPEVEAEKEKGNLC